MTERLPSGWRGRLFALSLALFTVAAIYVLAPLLGIYADRGARAEGRWALLVKLNGVAAETPSLRARASELRLEMDPENETVG